MAVVTPTVSENVARYPPSVKRGDAEVTQRVGQLRGSKVTLCAGVSRTLTALDTAIRARVSRTLTAFDTTIRFSETVPRMTVSLGSSHLLTIIQRAEKLYVESPSR